MIRYRMGQELVCINEEPWVNGYTGERCDGDNPIKGKIYHYAGTHQSIVDGDDYIFLEEFDGNSGPAFEASVFRPVTKTDISIFNEMLVIPPREMVPA